MPFMESHNVAFYEYEVTLITRLVNGSSISELFTQISPDPTSL